MTSSWEMRTQAHTLRTDRGILAFLKQELIDKSQGPTCGERSPIRRAGIAQFGAMRLRQKIQGGRNRWLTGEPSVGFRRRRP
jgi:hypothetical protein